MPHPRPTKADLLAARDKTLPDVIAPGLRLLFSGINPGLYSAAVGHHFGRPGNRFWPTLFAAGFTARLFHPSEQALLLKQRYGMTNIVKRATATANELTPDELIAGGRRLKRKVLRWRPAFLAVLGVTAYRTAFGRPRTVLGRQEERIGDCVVWVLPSPSGLNAHYQREALARLFRELREVVEG